MEVHHHPHVEKKNFKEYFLEFLMIFLAVTLGFFAENVRENISNNEHAKLLTEQLVKDLKTDTLNLQKVIGFDLNYQKTIDTLFFELQKPVAAANTKYIQQLIFNAYNVKLFNPSTGAISAIEKELNIKQFSGSDLPAMITNYQSKTHTSKQGEDLLFRLVEQNVESFMYTHVSPENAYSVFANNSLVKDAAIRNLKQDDMAELSVKLEVINAIVSNRIQWLTGMKSDAEKMMQYVMTRYNIKN